MRTNTGQILYIPKIGQRADFQHSLMKGCVGWWPLNDGGGDIAKDLSGNGNDGTQSGGVTWATTEKGTAASFDGVDDYIASDFSIGTTFTLSAWVKIPIADGTARYFVSINDSTSGSDQYMLACVSGMWWFACRSASSGGFRAAQGGTTTSGWTHLAGVSDGSSSRVLYVNGVNVGQNTANVTPSTIDNMVFGGLGDITPFYSESIIQNVRVYNRALSSTEILELYTNPWAGLSIPSETRYFLPLSQPSPTINPFSKIITSSTILNTSGKTVIRRGA